VRDKKNRKRALWKLYKAERKKMFGYALSITHSSGLAEDAVHEAFAKVAASNGPVRNLRGYVFQAVRNEALRSVAARDRTESLNDGEPELMFALPPEGNPDRRSEVREEAALLNRALDDLVFEQKETIVLRIYTGLTFRQIAAILDEPLPTVASRYRRGLEKLGERMRDLGYEA